MPNVPVCTASPRRIVGVARNVDVLSLLGADPHRVALRLAALLQTVLETHGVSVEAWVAEYRAAEVRDECERPGGMA
jgi:hypothetical protein